LRNLEATRQGFRAFKITASEHRELPTVLIDDPRQTVSILERHFTVAKHVDFETTQHSGSPKQFVQMANALIEDLKTARRIHRGKRVRDSQLLLEIVVTSRTAVRHLSCFVQQLHREFWILLLCIV